MRKLYIVRLLCILLLLDAKIYCLYGLESVNKNSTGVIQAPASRPSNPEFFGQAFKIEFVQNFEKIQKQKSQSTGSPDSKITNKKIVSNRGELTYKRPGLMRVKISAPDDQKMEYVVNERTSFLYTPPFDEGENGEVVIQGAKKIGIVSLFELLSNGLQSNKNYSVKKLGAGHFKLSILGKMQKKSGIREVDLHSTKTIVKSIQDIEKLEILNLEKKKLSFIFKNFQELRTVDSAVFQFEIPPKTNVIKN